METESEFRIKKVETKTGRWEDTKPVNSVGDTGRARERSVGDEENRLSKAAWSIMRERLLHNRDIKILRGDVTKISK